MKKPNFDVHYFPLYISRWRDSESRIALNLEQRMLYWELIFFCYRTGSLPNDRQSLVKIAACTEKEFDRAWVAVKRLFKDDGERLHHFVVDEILPTLEDRHDKRQRAGSEGGKARAARIALLQQTHSNAQPSEQSRVEEEKKEEKSSSKAGEPHPPTPLSDEEFSQPDRQHLAWALVADLQPLHWSTTNVPVARREAELILANALSPETVCDSIRANHASWKLWIEANPRERKKPLQFWLHDKDYLAPAPKTGVLATSKDGW